MNPDPTDTVRFLRALQLRETHYVKLAVYAVYLGCSWPEAQQVANDSLAQLAIRESGPAAEPVDNPRAWLYGVVRRKASETFRQRLHHSQLSDLPGDRLVDSDLGPEKHVEWLEVLDAIRQLAEEYRFPLELSIRGLSIAEIAETIGCSTDVVKQRICRARKSLRAKLGMDQPRGRSASTTGRAE